MNRLGIAARIHLIIGLSSAFAVGAIAFLLVQIGTVIDDTGTVLATQVRQRDMARVLEVQFKTQVQEWKNILLRGHDPRDLDQYRTAFFSNETAVRQVA